MAKRFPILMFSQLSLCSILVIPCFSEFNPSSLGIDLFNKFESSTPPQSKPQLPPTNEFSPDNSIDPASYYIGAGDRFTVSISDLPSTRYAGTVDLNGYLDIPEIGIIHLGKITLQAAVDTIRGYLKEKFRNSPDIHVSLSHVKQVTVTITGEVSHPGTYRFSGMTRLLEGIMKANGNQIPTIRTCNLREIPVMNHGKADTCDLFPFIFRQDQHSNPYLYSGDIIHISLASKYVRVDADLNQRFRGFIPFRRGETLSQLLSFFEYQPSADTGRIFFKRVDESEIREINMQMAGDIQLNHLDFISIPEKKEYPDITLASVQGEVVSPGSYPINEGETTAGSLLALAGGITEEANESRIVVIKRAKLPGPQNSAIQQKNKELLSNMGLVRPELVSGVSHSGYTRDYTVVRIEEDSGYLLSSEDMIVVPRREDLVYVSGSVRKPGAYSFREGESSGYYISQAGGYGKKADKRNRYIVRTYGDISQMVSNGIIQDGDMIIIPLKREGKTLSTIIPLSSLAIGALSVFISVLHLVR